MHCDFEAVLQNASSIPAHYLKQVRYLPAFDSWGIGIEEGKRPETLFIGENSGDFTPPCWSFMSCHEAVHSIGTFFFDADDYLFFLFNIFEDWRINQSVLAYRPELKESFKATRSVIIRRWNNDTTVYQSPLSRLLQGLCYMNHLERFEAVKPKAGVAQDFFDAVMAIRVLFGDSENWPQIEPSPDREKVNQQISLKLMNTLRGLQKPPNINAREILRLIHKNGYDMTIIRPNITAEIE